MSRGVELPWTIVGRRIRPFSFVLMLATLAVGVEFNVLATGPGAGLSSNFTGGFAFIAAFLLLTGWVLKADDVHDWGLLVSAGVWGARTSLFVMDADWANIGLYLSPCWAIGALGAYALERYDHRWRYQLARVGDE